MDDDPLGHLTDRQTGSGFVRAITGGSECVSGFFLWAAMCVYVLRIHTQNLKTNIKNKYTYEAAVVVTSSSIV